MATATMLQLPVASSVTGEEYAWINQGGTDKRTTLLEIANTATGWLPSDARINTPSTGGLSGGGLLSSDLTLTWAPSGLNSKSAMVIADTFAISDSAASGDPRKITFPNAMKALTGMSTLALPSATDDYLIINRGVDGDTYKINPQALGLGTGNVPAGGTVGQPLVKNSSTNFDSSWQTLPVIGGGTGQTTLVNHGVLLGQGTSGVSAVTLTDGQLVIGQTGTDPAAATVTGDVTISNLGVTTIGANKVTDAMLRQSAGLSVIGRSAATTGNVADIAGTAYQLLRVDSTGIALGFGSMDLSQSAAVGSSVLGATNGGTSFSTYTLGDTIYASAANTLSKLAGNTTAGIQYLSQTGTGAVSAAPVWATISGGDITGAALTASNDTNVTLTLGGTPATSLLRAASITAGWSGQLGVTRGGTGLGSSSLGDIIYGSAANTYSNLSGNTTATKKYLSQTGTGSASAAPSWAEIAGGDVTGAALTASNDTNVTLTLGGTPATSLLRAASITAGWSGQLGLTRGGTNASLIASNGGLVYSTASAFAILSGTATANQIVLSGSSTTPSWSTATYPGTTAAGTVLASASANTIAGTATPTLGANGATGGQITFNGSTSGSAALRVAAAAGTSTIFQLPATNGTSGYSLITDGSGNSSWASRVSGPVSSADTAVVRWNGTDGTTVQNSTVTLDGTGNFGGVTSVGRTGGVAVQGTNTNNSASAGYVGEYAETVVLVGSAISLTSLTQTTIATLSLTAGDWDVVGNIGTNLGAGATASALYASISTVTNNLGTAPNNGITSMVGIGGVLGNSSFNPFTATRRVRISLSATTDIYLVGLATFTGGTCGGYGAITARRAR